ncbi:MAG: hypothetical protein P8R54_25885 [Myxococcota bacterium]|nr:hypothetical protein [Myxococcota bacterium]
MLTLLLACASPRQDLEYTSDWDDPGSSLEVIEPVSFTDTPYDFPADSSAGIGAFIDAVFPVSAGSIAFGSDDQFGSGTDCTSLLVDELPWEVEAVVTLHPRYYFKTNGCDAASDEKYYGSYFIEDATGGVFVLGDSRVAHFDVGTKVRISLRGARTAYGLDMIYAHDVVAIERDVTHDVFYTEAVAALGADDVGEVRRVSGTVVSEKSTFGDFEVEADDGTIFTISLDSELSRRGIGFDLGTRIEATGPVILSYDVYSIVIMRVGQVQAL